MIRPQTESIKTLISTAVDLDQLTWAKENRASRALAWAVSNSIPEATQNHQRDSISSRSGEVAICGQGHLPEMARALKESKAEAAELRLIFQERDQEILAINQAMLESVASGNWEHYSQVCSADISCFEAESVGHLVEGLPFHRYYFNLASEEPNNAPAKVTVTMARPHLRWLNDDAVVLSYTRLTQTLQSGEPITSRCCETRVWQRIDNTWQQVHVHRS